LRRSVDLQLITSDLTSMIRLPEPSVSIGERCLVLHRLHLGALSQYVLITYLMYNLLFHVGMARQRRQRSRVSTSPSGRVSRHNSILSRIAGSLTPPVSPSDQRTYEVSE